MSDIEERYRAATAKSVEMGSAPSA